MKKTIVNNYLSKILREKNIDPIIENTEERVIRNLEDFKKIEKEFADRGISVIRGHGMEVDQNKFCPSNYRYLFENGIKNEESFKDKDIEFLDKIKKDKDNGFLPKTYLDMGYEERFLNQYGLLRDSYSIQHNRNISIFVDISYRFQVAAYFAVRDHDDFNRIILDEKTGEKIYRDRELLYHVPVDADFKRLPCSKIASDANNKTIIKSFRDGKILGGIAIASEKLIDVIMGKNSTSGVENCRAQFGSFMAADKDQWKNIKFIKIKIKADAVEAIRNYLIECNVNYSTMLPDNVSLLCEIIQSKSCFENVEENINSMYDKLSNVKKIQNKNIKELRQYISYRLDDLDYSKMENAYTEVKEEIEKIFAKSNVNVTKLFKLSLRGCILSGRLNKPESVFYYGEMMRYILRKKINSTINFDKDTLMSISSAFKFLGICYCKENKFKKAIAAMTFPEKYESQVYEDSIKIKSKKLQLNKIIATIRFYSNNETEMVKKEFYEMLDFVCKFVDGIKNLEDKFPHVASDFLNVKIKGSKKIKDMNQLNLNYEQYVRDCKTL